MKHISSLFQSILLLLCLYMPAIAADAIPAIAADASAPQDVLANIELTVPGNAEYRNYLGLKGEPGDTFTINDIDADVVLIELFSMYCPFCQEEAENVNALFEVMLEFSKPDLSIKMIGLGANNSEFEVDHFRTTYGVRFPLFPDQNMTMYNALGGKGTPSFIACKKEENNTCSVILRQSGGFYQADEFFNELLRKSGHN